MTAGPNPQSPSTADILQSLRTIREQIRHNWDPNTETLFKLLNHHCNLNLNNPADEVWFHNLYSGVDSGDADEMARLSGIALRPFEDKDWTIDSVEQDRPFLATVLAKFNAQALVREHGIKPRGIKVIDLSNVDEAALIAHLKDFATKLQAWSQKLNHRDYPNFDLTVLKYLVTTLQAWSRDLTHRDDRTTDESDQGDLATTLQVMAQKLNHIVDHTDHAHWTNLVQKIKADMSGPRPLK